MSNASRPKTLHIVAKELVFRPSEGVGLRDSFVVIGEDGRAAAILYMAAPRSEVGAAHVITVDEYLQREGAGRWVP